MKNQTMEYLSIERFNLKTFLQYNIQSNMSTIIILIERFSKNQNLSNQFLENLNSENPFSTQNQLTIELKNMTEISSYNSLKTQRKFMIQNLHQPHQFNQYYSLFNHFKNVNLDLHTEQDKRIIYNTVIFSNSSSRQTIIAFEKSFEAMQQSDECIATSSENNNASIYYNKLIIEHEFMRCFYNNEYLSKVLLINDALSRINKGLNDFILVLSCEIESTPLTIHNCVFAIYIFYQTLLTLPPNYHNKTLYPNLLSLPGIVFFNFDGFDHQINTEILSQYPTVTYFSIFSNDIYPKQSNDLSQTPLEYFKQMYSNNNISQNKKHFPLIFPSKEEIRAHYKKKGGKNKKYEEKMSKGKIGDKEFELFVEQFILENLSKIKYKIKILIVSIVFRPIRNTSGKEPDFEVSDNILLRSIARIAKKNNFQLIVVPRILIKEQNQSTLKVEKNQNSLQQFEKYSENEKEEYPLFKLKEQLNEYEQNQRTNFAISTKNQEPNNPSEEFERQDEVEKVYNLLTGLFSLFSNWKTDKYENESALNSQKTIDWKFLWSHKMFLKMIHKNNNQINDPADYMKESIKSQILSLKDQLQVPDFIKSTSNNQQWFKVNKSNGSGNNTRPIYELEISDVNFSISLHFHLEMREYFVLFQPISNTNREEIAVEKFTLIAKREIKCYLNKYSQHYVDYETGKVYLFNVSSFEKDPDTNVFKFKMHNYQADIFKKPKCDENNEKTSEKILKLKKLPDWKFNYGVVPRINPQKAILFLSNFSMTKSAQTIAKTPNQIQNQRHPAIFMFGGTIHMLDYTTTDVSLSVKPCVDSSNLFVLLLSKEPTISQVSFNSHNNKTLPNLKNPALVCCTDSDNYQAHDEISGSNRVNQVEKLYIFGYSCHSNNAQTNLIKESGIENTQTKCYSIPINEILSSLEAEEHKQVIQNTNQFFEEESLSNLELLEYRQYLSESFKTKFNRLFEKSSKFNQYALSKQQQSPFNYNIDQARMYAIQGEFQSALRFIEHAIESPQFANNQHNLIILFNFIDIFNRQLQNENISHKFSEELNNILKKLKSLKIDVHTIRKRAMGGYLDNQSKHAESEYNTTSLIATEQFKEDLTQLFQGNQNINCENLNKLKAFQVKGREDDKILLIINKDKDDIINRKPIAYLINLSQPIIQTQPVNQKKKQKKKKSNQKKEEIFQSQFQEIELPESFDSECFFRSNHQNILFQSETSKQINKYSNEEISTTISINYLDQFQEYPNKQLYSKSKDRIIHNSNSTTFPSSFQLPTSFIEKLTITTQENNSQVSENEQNQNNKTIDIIESINDIPLLSQEFLDHDINILLENIVELRKQADQKVLDPRQNAHQNLDIMLLHESQQLLKCSFISLSFSFQSTPETQVIDKQNQFRNPKKTQLKYYPKAFASNKLKGSNLEEQITQNEQGQFTVLNYSNTNDILNFTQNSASFLLEITPNIRQENRFNSENGVQLHSIENDNTLPIFWKRGSNQIISFSKALNRCQTIQIAIYYNKNNNPNSKKQYLLVPDANQVLDLYYSYEEQYMYILFQNQISSNIRPVLMRGHAPIESLRFGSSTLTKRLIFTETIGIFPNNSSTISFGVTMSQNLCQSRSIISIITPEKPPKSIENNPDNKNNQPYFVTIAENKEQRNTFKDFLLKNNNAQQFSGFSLKCSQSEIQRIFQKLFEKEIEKDNQTFSISKELGSFDELSDPTTENDSEISHDDIYDRKKIRSGEDQKSIKSTTQHRIAYIEFNPKAPTQKATDNFLSQLLEFPIVSSLSQTLTSLRIAATCPTSFYLNRLLNSAYNFTHLDLSACTPQNLNELISLSSFILSRGDSLQYLNLNSQKNIIMYLLLNVQKHKDSANRNNNLNEQQQQNRVNKFRALKFIDIGNISLLKSDQLYRIIRNILEFAPNIMGINLHRITQESICKNKYAQSLVNVSQLADQEYKRSPLTTLTEKANRLTVYIESTAISRLRSVEDPVMNCLREQAHEQFQLISSEEAISFQEIDLIFSKQMYVQEQQVERKNNENKDFIILINDKGEFEKPIIFSYQKFFFIFEEVCQMQDIQGKFSLNIYAVLEKNVVESCSLNTIKEEGLIRIPFAQKIFDSFQVIQVTRMKKNAIPCIGLLGIASIQDQQKQILKIQFDFPNGSNVSQDSVEVFQLSKRDNSTLNKIENRNRLGDEHFKPIRHSKVVQDSSICIPDSNSADGLTLLTAKFLQK